MRSNLYNRTWIFFAVTLLCCSGVLNAQTVFGTILGTVTDQQGGSVSGGEVSARNLDTGAVRKTNTDSSGTYRISSIPAGTYSVTVTASGFKTEVETPITVTVGGDISANFAMALGAVSEKIEVTAETPQVDTTTATLGGFVNSATIRELPLNGRDWLQLALLQPGVASNTGQSQADSNRAQRGNGIAISISGGRSTDNAFRIDGLIVNDYANAGPGSSLRVNMGVDAIREFSVLTNSYSAEYGRGSGGIVNAITKSGTNLLHGSAYYFHRNSALDARNFFDKDIPPFRRHQYGGSVGGPIRKDKTFFFTNYEALTEFKSLSYAQSTLSANAHLGILCANSACSQTTQVNIDPRVKPYLALYPNPNGPVSGDTGLYLFGAGRNGDEKYVIGKIDHYFSATTTLSGSYSYDNTTVTVPDDFNLKLANSPARRQNAALNFQHLFSSSLINNARVGVTRTYAGGNVDGSPKIPALTDTSLGFLPGRSLGNIVISSGISGVFGGIGAGQGVNGRSIFGYTAPQVYDDLAWTKGRNSIRIGVSVERIDYNLNSADTPNGRWTFSTIQNFLQAVPSLFNGDFPGTDTVRGERSTVFGAYIQDDFRIASNLTINLGVRYEMATPVDEVNGKIANLRNLTDPKVTVGGPLYNNPTLKNFAPRLGFAWDPFRNGKTALRGGFGMFDIVPLPYLFVNRYPRSTPFYQAGSLANPPSSSFPSNIFQLLGPATVRAAHVEFNPHRSYKAQWNFNIQRQLTKDIALTAGYVGSAGVHLTHLVEDADQVPATLVTWQNGHYVFPIPAAGQPIQRINTNFGRIAATEWSGHSSYHAMQVNLVQRPVKHLSYQIAYTWSKSIDNGSSTFSDNENSNNAGASWAFDPRINRGVSDYDIPHNFVANFLYDLPIPGPVSANAFGRTVLGGWQVGGIYTRQSGGPFTLKIGNDRAFTGNSTVGGTTGAQRPDFLNIPGCSPNAVTGNIDNYINTACFAYPAPGVLGNLGRNTLRMPTYRDLDFSVFKNQNLWGEKLKMQFRAEMFNLLNNTNLQTQMLVIFDGSGKLVGNVGQPHSPTVNTSRQIQFGLRFLF
jgi:hypothetical protein